MSDTLGGSEKNVTTTSDSSPWAPQQPYLKTGFEKAQGILDGGPQQYYQGQTVADTSGQTSQGQFDAFGQAQRAGALNQRTIGGEFLDAGNPHFQGMMSQFAKGIRPGIDSAFAGNGRLGSGAHANAFTSAVADQGAKMAYQNYGDERGRQIAASQDYSAPNAMMGVGRQIEAKQGEYNADGMNRWNFAQNADQAALDRFMATVGGQGYGGQKSSSQPYTGNGLMETFGTGISAASALTGLLKSLKGG